MKKIVSLVLVMIICMIFFGCVEHTKFEPNYTLLRLHIRANSNSDDDQNVKMAVKEKVATFLEERLQGTTQFSEAYEKVKGMLDDIESVAKTELVNCGQSYGARARLNNEYFPTRKYYDVVVSSGYYDALIIELGDGSGDNWWCVIYPPLCFSGSAGNGKIVYRSKIKELWDKFIKKEEQKEENKNCLQKLTRKGLC